MTNDWTAEKVIRLRTLWAEGLSLTKIGQRIGMSKNAVAGKAHRLQLSTRPSPIRRSTKPKKPTIARAGKYTLPPPPSLSETTQTKPRPTWTAERIALARKLYPIHDFPLERILHELNELPGNKIHSVGSICTYMHKSGVRRVLPVTNNDVLLELYTKGLSWSAIARKMGIAPASVRDRAKRLGLKNQKDRKPEPLATLEKPIEPRPSFPTPRPLPFPLQAMPIPRPRTCQWPFGDPKASDFRMCNATPLAPGKPYCATHAALAYERRPDTNGTPYNEQEPIINTHAGGEWIRKSRVPA